MTLRWVVHGTDAVTGEAVSLGVNEGGAAEAVQAALGRRMVVNGVIGHRWVRASVAAGLLSAAVIGVMGTALWQQRSAARHEAAAGWTEVARLRGVVAENESMMQRMEERGESRGSIAALEAATAREKKLETQLKQAEAEAAGRQAAEAEVTRLQLSLKASQRDEGKLADAVKAQIEAAKGAAERARAAEEQLAGLTAEKQAAVAQMDAMKGELLLAVAKPSDSLNAAKSEDEPAARGPTRWALKIGYGAASEFVAMRFEKESMTTTSVGHGEFEWTATAGANAARVRVLYDKTKERVFAATLSIGLAADGPAGRVAENRELLADFLKLFAPGVKGDFADRAVMQLTGHDSAERMVVVAQDAKVSVWNNGEGLYTWRVESVGNELE